tara:strand:+ start:1388 stop:2389 length:1002 start_codon:yes stop_codon:yes gene_type:complete
MLKKVPKSIWSLIVVIVSILPFGLMKTDYYFMAPGPPYQWDIAIEGAESYDYQGNLYQLTVRRDEANYFTYVWAKVDNSVDLYSREVILPKGVTPQELSEISIQNMKTSENVAIAVALNFLDYEIDTQGDGVLVVGIMDDSPVAGKLLKEDLIISINNEVIKSTTEFISLLRTYEIGDMVSLGLIRNDKEMNIETKLIEHIDYENEPMVGFLASTPNQRFVFPISVDIDTGNVGGPSAGLMMALNVYNSLTEYDITKGIKVAGTGTIEIDGSVGPVGGVKQKVIAAKNAGSTLILVPTSNFDDVQSYIDEETSIVSVDTFNEALNLISEYSSR